MKTKEKIKYFSIKHFAKNFIKMVIESGVPPTLEKNFYCQHTLEHGIDNFHWKIGRHSYGNPAVIDAGYGASLEIGSFTSIANDVTIILANHDIKNISTYPFSAIKKLGINTFFSELEQSEDHITKGDVIIGSDVWIGSGVTILPGVTIGHGSVIGANAVVTKSMPPYSVCVGNPARVVKLRFEKDKIEKLLEIEWWNMTDINISKIVNKIQSKDIDNFIQYASHG